MMWRDAVVVEERRIWGREGRRCGDFEVVITAAPEGAEELAAGSRCRAVVYEQIHGLPALGERVRLEVSALAKGLGTGGHAMITARLDALPADPAPGGHLVKARYMPEQVMVTGVDEQETEHHALLAAPVGELSLEGAPVVVADLHSALPAIMAGLTSPGGGEPDTLRPPRTAYVMTDGGALPAAYSRSATALTEAEWLAGTVTCGQAWGGDVEAVSIHNALLAARHVLGAEVIVVAQGPGNLGTDTPWGFSGLAVGEVLNAASILGGTPIACLRASQADARERHQGISHHSLTALHYVALRESHIAVPDFAGLSPSPIPESITTTINSQIAALLTHTPHHAHTIPLAGLMGALEHMQDATGVTLSTMGRNLAEDPASFLTAAAAGRYASSLLR